LAVIKKTDCTDEERARADTVIGKLYRLMMRAHDFDARPREFGTGQRLSRAEIHTVQIADCWYIRYEEKMMADTFGSAYADYCARTRRWF
jgi:hypothetical protein